MMMMNYLLYIYIRICYRSKQRSQSEQASACKKEHGPRAVNIHTSQFTLAVPCLCHAKVFEGSIHGLCFHGLLAKSLNINYITESSTVRRQVADILRWAADRQRDSSHSETLFCPGRVGRTREKRQGVKVKTFQELGRTTGKHAYVFCQKPWVY